MKGKCIGLGLFFIFSIVFLANICFAKENLYVEITDYGIYKVEEIKKEKSEGETATGKIGIIINEKLIKQTTDIPAKLGVNFGFHFIIRGGEKGKKVKILFKHFFPPLHNPETKKTYTEEYCYTYVPIGEKWFHGYGFDYPWEVVPGRWVFQIWYEGEKLSEKVFYVHE